VEQLTTNANTMNQKTRMLSTLVDLFKAEGK